MCSALTVGVVLAVVLASKFNIDEVNLELFVRLDTDQ